MPVCGDCGGTVIEYDAAAGNGFCTKCGTVVEENTIVSEVTFGETSSGAAIVQGSYVGHGSTHARMSGPFGIRGSSESREQTVANASKKIRSVANILRLSEVVQLSALRMYTLALEHKFTKGRRNMNVIAVCLYIACRQKETRNYMLIDFSDLLQVNVFELGHTYLQLVQTLNLRLPLVDPSHYISRFAALLEFGDETPKVATDAVRLVQRFDRDWMTKGRRPAGICGASLLLAARMNNFRRSIQEIVQVVKIADTTVKQRLNEFKKTPSGALTLADFRTVWLEDEMDPPAFTKGKEKEAREAVGESDEEEEEEPGTITNGRRKKRKKRRQVEEEGEEIEGAFAAATIQEDSASTDIPIDLHLLQQSIFSHAYGQTPMPLFLPDEDESSVSMTPNTFDNQNIDPALLVEDAATQAARLSSSPNVSGVQTEGILPPSDFEQQADTVIADEVNDFLTNVQGSTLAEALEDAEQRRQAQFTVVDELLGLDEEELDDFILTEEEVKIKERVWVELNKDYLEAIAVRDAQKSEAEVAGKSKKRRKTHTRPRDSSTPHGNTPAESVRNLIKKTKKFSRRINYEALNDLFVEDADTPTLVRSPETDHGNATDDVVYTYDDRSDGESMMVVVEETGEDILHAKSPRMVDNGKKGDLVEPKKGVVDDTADGPNSDEEDAEGEGVGASEYETDYNYGEDYFGWDEGYQQEV